MTTLQKTLFPVAAGVVLVLAALWLIQGRAESKLHAENESLRQQLAQLRQLTTGNEHRLQPLVESTPSPLSSPEPTRELLRLRGEVSLLRQQNQGLAKLVAEKQQTTPRVEFTPSSSWADSGNATPEAAAGTFAWAIKTGQKAKLATVLCESDPTVRNDEAVVEQVSKGLQSFLAEIEASRLLFTDDSTPDQVTLWYQNRLKDGHTLVSPLTLQRVGDYWKVRLVLGQ